MIHVVVELSKLRNKLLKSIEGAAQKGRTSEKRAHKTAEISERKKFVGNIEKKIRKFSSLQKLSEPLA